MSLNASSANREACLPAPQRVCPSGCKRSEGARNLRPGGARSAPYGCAPQATYLCPLMEYQVAQCPVEVPRTSEGVESCAAAWRGCRTKRHRQKRTACERQARKRYGPAHIAKNAPNKRRRKI